MPPLARRSPLSSFPLFPPDFRTLTASFSRRIFRYSTHIFSFSSPFPRSSHSTTQRSIATFSPPPALPSANRCWARDEHERLFHAILQTDLRCRGSWKLVGALVGTRTAEQCRKRIYRYLWKTPVFDQMKSFSKSDSTRFDQVGIALFILSILLFIGFLCFYTIF